MLEHKNGEEGTDGTLYKGGSRYIWYQGGPGVGASTQESGWDAEG